MAGPDAPAADGRRQRSERSRALIVDAMFELVRGGDVSPSAASVAEAAGVSLRSVFRHFEDMDSLYREMSDRIALEVMPEVLKPYEAAGWRGRLDELLTRRAGVFERIFPFRVSGDLRRFQSPFLMNDHRRILELERAGLQAVLPPDIVAGARLFAAIEVVAGFQSWRRLRQDQGLSASDAEAVVRFTVERLLAGR